MELLQITLLYSIALFNILNSLTVSYESSVSEMHVCDGAKCCIFFILQQGHPIPSHPSYLIIVQTCFEFVSHVPLFYSTAGQVLGHMQRTDVTRPRELLHAPTLQEMMDLDTDVDGGDLMRCHEM